MRRPARTSFVAQFAGRCACCDGYFPAGTKVTYAHEGGLVVVECPNEEGDIPSEAERAQARRTMCGKCYMVHAGECL